MMLHGDHGSAWRRRQRRLRSWKRHEQQSVAMALSAAAHHSFDKVAAGAKYDGLRAQKTDRAGEAANKAPRRQKSKAAGKRCSSSCLTKTPRGCGSGFSPSLGRRNVSGTSWSTSPTSSDVLPWCRFSTFLCRRRWNSCQTCSGSSTGLRLFPSRLSKCPRLFLRTSLCARFCVTSSWRNTWWKRQRSYSILGCSLVSSRTSPFQFLVVEGETLVFKVFFPDRVQQRCMLLSTSFLSGLWSRSLLFPVKAFKIFSQNRVHPLLCTFELVFLTVWTSLEKCFFALFSQNKKVRSRFRTQVRGCPLVSARPRRHLSTVFVSGSGS